MFRPLIAAAAFAAFASLAACTTVQSAYLTNLSSPVIGCRADKAGPSADTNRSCPVATARPIQAESSKMVFLGMNFDNNYAFEARESLYSQCPGGMVTGVLSTYETRSYVFLTKHVVRARGYCSEAAQ